MKKNIPVLLLVEDNPDDVELTRVALDDSKLANLLVVVRDGQEALDWLWCEGEHKDRDPCQAPSLALLDLKLPKISGLEVLRRMRSDPRTKCDPRGYSDLFAGRTGSHRRVQDGRQQLYSEAGRLSAICRGNQAARGLLDGSE